MHQIYSNLETSRMIELIKLGSTRSTLGYCDFLRKLQAIKVLNKEVAFPQQKRDNGNSALASNNSYELSRLLNGEPAKIF